MNEAILQLLEEEIMRQDAVIASLKPLRDRFPNDEEARTTVEDTLRRAQADRSDAVFERAHVRAKSVQITTLSEQELADMKAQLVKLDEQLRSVQSVQALIRFADGALTTIQEHRSRILSA